MSALFVVLIILAVFAAYQEERLNSLDGELNTLQQSVSSLTEMQATPGLLSAQTVASGYLQIFAPGANRLASFLANESGVLKVEVTLYRLNGSITVRDGSVLVGPFPVVVNATISNTVTGTELFLLTPGNVTVSFLPASGDPSGTAILTPLPSITFTLVYYCTQCDSSTGAP